MLEVNIFVTLIILLIVNLFSCADLIVDYCFGSGYCAIRLAPVETNSVICRIRCGSVLGIAPNEACEQITPIDIQSNCSSESFTPQLSENSVEVFVGLCENGYCRDDDLTWTIDTLSEPPIFLATLVLLYDSHEHNITILGGNFFEFNQPYFEINSEQLNCQIKCTCLAAEANLMNCFVPKISDFCSLPTEYAHITMIGQFYSHGAIRSHYNKEFSFYPVPIFSGVTWNSETNKFIIEYIGEILFKVQAVCFVTDETNDSNERMVADVEFAQLQLTFTLDHEKLAYKTLSCYVEMDSHVFQLGTVYVAYDAELSSKIKTTSSSEVFTEKTTTEEKNGIDSSRIVIFLDQNQLYLIAVTVISLVAIVILLGLTSLRKNKSTRKNRRSRYSQFSNSGLSSVLSSRNEMSRYNRRRYSR